MQDVINPNVLKDFNNMGNPCPTYNNTNCAYLYLYSPVEIPAQVLRTYQYSFSENFKEGIMDYVRKYPERTFHNAAGNDPGLKVPDLNTTILPGDGVVADIGNWNSLWTFTLIIDHQQTNVGNITGASGRIIASGYCYYAEPGVLDATGQFIPNKNCVLVFTHVTNLSNIITYAPNAPSDNRKVCTSTFDYAGDSIAMLYDQSMYLGTPRELLKTATLQSDAPGFSDYEPIKIGNLNNNNGAMMIDNELKSAKTQLSTILSSIDHGIESAKSGNAVYSRMAENDDDVPIIDRAIQSTMNTLPSADSQLFRTFGFRTDVPCNLGELIEHFPNIYIKPCIIRNETRWDVAQQVGMDSHMRVGPIVSYKQIYSALAANTIQAICSSLGIASVAFTYTWYDTDNFVVRKNDSFRLEQFGLMMPRPNDVTIDYAKTMKLFLDNQLFEVIHDNVGEFSIYVMFDMASTILVNLRIFGYNDDQDGAYYQTDCRLGGILNPSVGTLQTTNTNVQQLYGAVRDLAGPSLAEHIYDYNPQFMPNI